MNTRLNVLVMTSAALLLGLAWTGTTIAQQSERTMPEPEVDRASCSEVEWHRDLLSDYPWVVEACHEAIVVDGKKFARFEAEFQEFHRDDGAITSNFKNNRGRSLGSVRLMPGDNQHVMIDGRETEFSQLRRGQTLNFYAPEDMYGFTTEPGAPARDLVEIVEPVEEERPARRVTEREPDTRQQDRQQDRLPATAGPLPIIALGGLLSLLGGFALTIRRRFKISND